jgi:PAS domain S-box-containing protein
MAPTSPPPPDDEQALGELAAELGALRGENMATLLEIRALFELSREMMVIAGFDGYFQLVSPAWTTTLGHARADLCAAPFLDFVHPEDLEVTRTVVERLTRNGRLISFQNRYRHRDGSYRALSWRATVSMERQRIYAVAMDVSDRVSARQDDSLLAAVLETAGDAVIVQSMEGTITRWNPAAERLCGWAAAEVVGRPIAVVRAPGASADVRAHLDHGDAEHRDGVLLHKDGHEVRVTVTVAPLGDGSGQITGAVTLARARSA